MIRTAKNFIEAVFKWNLAEFDANEDKLRTIVEQQCNEDTPVLMASTPGNDPSSMIDKLAAEVFESQVSRKYDSFAMGSPEDYEKADNAITQATKRGTWVLLKNVHLSPGWLQSLEKRLHRLKKDPAFRVFMTMEIHPKVPVTLLRKSCVIIWEPPLGIKASLQRTFNRVDGSRVDRQPEERSRLYILLAWLHAVVLERLRFEPMGWSKGFEFSETDLFCAMDALDEWIDKLAQNRNNIDPNEIPWDALHKMLVQYVYGGRVDNKYDTARLTSFVENLFTPESYNNKFALASLIGATESNDNQIGRLGYVYPVIDGTKLESEMLARLVDVNNDKYKIVYIERYVVIGKKRINLNGTDNWINASDFRSQKFELKPTVIIPEKTKFADIRKWVLNVDEVIVSNPALIGLPPRAELMILAKKARNMCTQLMSLQDVETGNAMDELSAILDKSSNDEEDAAGAVPSWMKELRKSSEKWLEDLPETLAKLVETAESIKNPIFRFMRREFQIGRKVLNAMKSGLSNICKFVDGEIKATNDLRQLVASLAKDAIPKRWNIFAIDKQIVVTYWIVDFIKRVEQLNLIAECDYVNKPEPCLWLGSFFSAEGFIAATRQYIASLNKWPLESLTLYVEIGENQWIKNSFIFQGLTLYGAGWDKTTGCLVLTEKTSTPLPPSRFLWKSESDEEKENRKKWKGNAPDIIHISIPVYLNASFKELLFSVELPVFSSIPAEVWVQRAVSLAVWTN